MTTYALIIKGNADTAKYECEKRNIPIKSINESYDDGVIIHVEDDDGHNENWESMINRLNKWMGEDIGQCEQGRGYPNGSLLFWNEVL